MSDTEVREENDRLRRLLDQVEWVMVAANTLMCPVCCGTRRPGRPLKDGEGHTDNCELASVLGAHHEPL